MYIYTYVICVYTRSLCLFICLSFSLSLSIYIYIYIYLFISIFIYVYILHIRNHFGSIDIRCGLDLCSMAIHRIHDDGTRQSPSPLFRPDVADAERSPSPLVRPEADVAERSPSPFVEYKKMPKEMAKQLALTELHASDLHWQPTGAPHKARPVVPPKKIMQPSNKKLAAKKKVVKLPTFRERSENYVAKQFAAVGEDISFVRQLSLKSLHVVKMQIESAMRNRSDDELMFVDEDGAMLTSDMSMIAAAADTARDLQLHELAEASKKKIAANRLRIKKDKEVANLESVQKAKDTMKKLELSSAHDSRIAARKLQEKTKKANEDMRREDNADIDVLKRNFKRMHNIVAPGDKDLGTFRPI